MYRPLSHVFRNVHLENPIWSDLCLIETRHKIALRRLILVRQHRCLVKPVSPLKTFQQHIPLPQLVQNRPPEQALPGGARLKRASRSWRYAIRTFRASHQRLHLRRLVTQAEFAFESAGEKDD